MAKYENIGSKNPTGPERYIKERAMILQENDGRTPRLAPKNPEEFTNRELFGLGVKVLVTYRGQADQYPVIVWHIRQNLENRDWLISLLKRYHIYPVVFRQDGTDEEKAGLLKLIGAPSPNRFAFQNRVLNDVLMEILPGLLLKLAGAKNINTFFYIQTTHGQFNYLSEYVLARIEESNKIRKEVGKKTK